MSMCQEQEWVSEWKYKREREEESVYTEEMGIWKTTVRGNESKKQSNVNQAGLDYRWISHNWLRSLGSIL